TEPSPSAPAAAVHSTEATALAGTSAVTVNGTGSPGRTSWTGLVTVTSARTAPSASSRRAVTSIESTTTSLWLRTRPSARNPPVAAVDTDVVRTSGPVPVTPSTQYGPTNPCRCRGSGVGPWLSASS